MNPEPELIALIAAIVGALIALAYKWLKSQFENVPDIDEVIGVVLQIVVAARENHDLPDNAARLDWAMERVQKYLNAMGWGKHLDARALVEYALDIVKKTQ